MKKKVFYQHHLEAIILELVLLAFMGLLIYCGIFIFEKIGGKLIVGIVTIPVLINLLSVARYRIVIDDKGISAPGHWAGKDSKIQYKTKVNNEDIVRFRIITSARNSKNEKLYASRMISNHVIKAYLEFTLISGKTERIYIHHFTKKQWVKIIDEIKLRLANSGNNIELQDTMAMINCVDTKTIFYYE